MNIRKLVKWSVLVLAFVAYKNIEARDSENARVYHSNLSYQSATNHVPDTTT